MEYRELLNFVYQQHNPQKIAEIDNLLRRHRGGEELLLSRVCLKYNVDRSTITEKYQEWRDIQSNTDKGNFSSDQEAEYNAYQYNDEFERLFGRKKKKSRKKWLYIALGVLVFLGTWEVAHHWYIKNLEVVLRYRIGGNGSQDIDLKLFSNRTFSFDLHYLRSYNEDKMVFEEESRYRAEGTWEKDPRGIVLKYKNTYNAFFKDAINESCDPNKVFRISANQVILQEREEICLFGYMCQKVYQ